MSMHMGTGRAKCAGAVLLQLVAGKRSEQESGNRTGRAESVRAQAHRACTAFAVVLAAGVVGGAANVASADLIAYEPFDYTGGSTIAGRNGGTGFSGPWQDMLGTAGRGQLVTQDSGLNHTLRPGTGRSSGATLGQQAIAVVRPFDYILLDQQTVWMSLLYRGASSATPSVAMGLVFGTQTGFGSVPAVRASAQGVYQLYVEGSQTAINLPVPGPSSTRTDLIVVRYQSLGNNTLEFAAFVNPANPTNPGTPTITRVVTLPTMQIAAFRMIYAGPPSNATSTARMDELGIAETYPGLIPSPGPAAVAMLAGLALLTRRRCRA